MSEDVLDIITSLVEKSLVNVDEGEDGARYRLLETLRDYGREKLILRDEQIPIKTSHCDYFLTLAKASNKGLQGPEQAEWTRRIENVHDDMRAAIRLALDGGVDPIIAVKFEVALLGFWMLRGYATEGRGYVREALASPSVKASELVYAHALYVGAGLADSQSDRAEARRMLEECLDLRRRLGNPVDIAATLSTLSLVRLHVGDAEGALKGEVEALEIFRKVNNRIGEAIGLQHLGEINAYTGNDAEARRYFDQCIGMAHAIGYSEIESGCEVSLGEIALDANDLKAGRERFSRSLDMAQSTGDKRGEAVALWWLGKTDLISGDCGAAGFRLGGALRAFQAFEMHEELLGCLEDHAALFQAVGDGDGAARLFAAAEISRARLAVPRSPRSERRVRNHIAAVRAGLGITRFDAAWSAGSVTEIGGAFALALTVAAKGVAMAA